MQLKELPRNEVVIAFYKGGYTLVDRAIKIWTRGPYSHCAIVINKGEVKYELSSSGMRGGVYKKVHNFNPYIWDYLILPNIEKEKIWDFYDMTMFDGYDFLAIFGFIIPFQDREHKWTCSEWCSNVLKIAGEKRLWRKEPYKQSPNSLARILGILN